VPGGPQLPTVFLAVTSAVGTVNQLVRLVEHPAERKKVVDQVHSREPPFHPPWRKPSAAQAKK
jgi:hypothetical protein